VVVVVVVVSVPHDTENAVRERDRNFKAKCMMLAIPHSFTNLDR
jgi:hypothetical protein